MIAEQLQSKGNKVYIHYNYNNHPRQDTSYFSYSIRGHAPMILGQVTGGVPEQYYQQD